MPLFAARIDTMMDTLGAAAMTVYLHTAAPTDSAPTNGRVTGGGTGYTGGQVLAVADISDAASGLIENTAAIAFGTASGAVGTVNHWSAYAAGSPHSYGTLPSTTIGDGDSFTINANTLDFNGSST